ncbi:sugar ABC transporter ATP-binding protein [Treponema sp.]
MTGDLLTIRHICKTYNAVKALVDVNLSISVGEIHCIVGENGCGKSTLMKIIAGVIPPDPTNGRVIEINQKAMTNYNPTVSMREGIQVIYQDLSLFPNLTVAENILTNDRIENRRLLVNYRDMYRKAEEALKEIQVPIDPHRMVSELPVAHQQLVAVSRAITNKVRLLIMDEPTASLGKSDVEHLTAIIRRLKSRGISIIFIGHKLDEVMRIADRITVMRDGRIVKTIGDTSSVSEDELTYLMTGKTHQYDPYLRGSALKTDPVLELRHFSRSGEFKDINLSLHRGEILGIIGLIGAGRTELLSTIFGLRTPDSGEMFVDGRAVKVTDVGKAIEAGIGLVPENRLAEGLFLTKPIKDNINVTILDKLTGILGLLSGSKLEKSAASWVSKLRIKTPNHRNPATSLSGGNQQRIVLAKWIANDPKVLLLDGPTIGIDIGAKSEIHQLIRRLATENDIGIILVTDEITEVLQNASRIFVMKDGAIILEAPREGLDASTIRKALGNE